MSSLGHVVVCLLVAGAMYLAQGAPANDTLFLIARAPVNSKVKLISIEWDLPAKTAKTMVLSDVPNSYSHTNTLADFDPVNSKLYWSTGPGKLFAADITASVASSAPLVTLKATDSLPFAVDDVTRHIFYADSGAIYVMPLDGKYSGKVVTVTGQSVVEIGVDPGEGYLFWLSSNSSDMAIYRSDMTGGNVKKLYAFTSKDLEGFTVDRKLKCIYYINGTTVNKMDYQGTSIKSVSASGLRTIVSAGQEILYGITFSKSLMKIDMTAGTSTSITSPITQMEASNKGIAFYSPQSTAVTNKCSSGSHSCTHFCLPGPAQSFKCACPENYVFEKNSVTACESLISCKAITPPDHSKVDCYRDTGGRQFCNFTCNAVWYVYHPRYTLVDVFECKSKTWEPEPSIKPCLAITNPIGYRIHGHVTFTASNACHVAKNVKAVRSETLSLLRGAGGPLQTICATQGPCRAGTPLVSCDDSANLLKVTFHFDIEKSFSESQKTQLKNDITTNFAKVMQNPSNYKITIVGVAYPVVNLTFVRLGHACSAYYEEVENGCVVCPAGSYYNSATDRCVLCAKGYYQTAPRSSSCSKCGSIQTTFQEGSTSPLQCKEFCDTGLYLDFSTKTCKECAVGSYQDKAGIDPCKPCGGGKTTYGKGSKLASDCHDLCSPGQYHNKNTTSCQPCQKNFYQSQTWAYSCTICPNGMVTEGVGAKSEEECIISCHAGKFFNTNKRFCESCHANYYQDTDGTTSCVKCPDDLVSPVGSASRSDCDHDARTATEGPTVVYGSIGGVGGVVLLLVVILSVFFCKKRCSGTRDDGVIRNQFEAVDSPQLHRQQNGHAGGPFPNGVGYDPRTGTIIYPPQPDEDLYTSLQLESTPRSRHERYGEMAGPFWDHGAPSVPDPRYSLPPKRIDEDSNSDVYDVLKEVEDGYDKLKDDAEGPTEPVGAGGVYVDVNESYLRPNSGVGGAEGGNEDYMVPSRDIRINTGMDPEPDY